MGQLSPVVIEGGLGGGRTEGEATPGRSFGFGGHARVRGSNLSVVFLRWRRIVVEVVQFGGLDGGPAFVLGLHVVRSWL